MKICMVGAGYVGLVSGACFAEMGHEVICVDISEEKILGLREGKIPIYEPGLEELVKRNVAEQRLSFSTSLVEAVKECLFIFIAVGTPPDEDGSADLKHVLAVARGVAENMTEFRVIVNKSTVPVGTATRVREEIQAVLASKGKAHLEFDVVSNPEFLKEGDAIVDFMRPDRIVVGVDNVRTQELVRELYAPFVRNGHPIMFMSVRSSEMTKYAANAMLATRISFMNELSRLCERVGSDIEDVRRGIGSDSRIGMPFLYGGLGYGGSCFPKDVQALMKTQQENDLEAPILRAVMKVNEEQRIHYLKKIIARYGENLQGKVFGVWGLSFKPKTDDMREAPAITIIDQLLKRGATIHAYDPEAMEVAKGIFNDRIKFCNHMYDAIQGVDAMLLLTEWTNFRAPDWERMKKAMREKVIFDGRNQYDRAKMTSIGFEYHCIGRGSV